MTNNNTAVPNSLQAFTNCPDWGKGGQFLFDPATGKRIRVVTDAADNAQNEAEPLTASNTKKEKIRANAD